MTTTNLYILGDADRVREKIESQLLAGNLADVSKISSTLISALAKLVSSVEISLDAETLMAGGDDVIFSVRPDAYNREALERISVNFYRETGSSMSFGVGTMVTIAYLNLRRAKAAGGGIIVEEGGAQ
ncbi:MAG TPA: hypothetical protein VN851_12885 [Thermoanaerobaculia bacterium]|nr:hypothetical protein [Thermoanaerobaculia bacterium]